MKVISRNEAQIFGLKRYFTGLPCKHGHLVERKVLDRSCVECNKIKSRKGSKLYYIKNRDREREKRRRHYEENSQSYKDRARQNEAKNPERTRESKRNWRRTEKGLAQSRNWTANNREAHASSTRSWKSRNPDKIAEYTGTRRAARLQATLPWLTPEDRIDIRVFYTEAKRRHKETGVKHHVDHIIPLQHEAVCGLHVSWNLQVLTESENATKGNRVSLDARVLVT